MASHMELLGLMGKLQTEVKHIRGEHPALSEDNAFVLWFAEAYLVGDRKRAFDAVIGSSGDKTIDAVYVDESNRTIHLVQGKYHKKGDVLDDSELYKFAARARDFWDPDFAEELKSAGPGARLALQKVHKLLHLNREVDFRLKMYFATTGKISPKSARRAKRITARVNNTDLEMFDRPAVLALFGDWLEGSSPPLGKLEIGVDGPHTLVHQDGHKGLQGWIFTATSHEVIRLFRSAQERLFARNVRGYLGADTSINKEIVNTAKKAPERFWFLNNGITIIANHVEKHDSGKQVRMHMWNPQVVNGQQTVRALAKADSNSSRVLVRLIRLERPTAKEGIVGLVGKVVRATNRQNAIKPADLMANDAEQVRIERELRKLHYAYERKRQDSKEFSVNAFKRFKVKREDLANAISATLFGAHTVRRVEQWESNYSKLFTDKRSISDYLARWWASQQVRDIASVTDSALGEARWVVLACLWGWSDLPLRGLLSSEMHRRAFIRACEAKDGRVLGHLRAVAKQVFTVAKSVYTTERRAFAREAERSGKPFKVLTPDAFFRQSRASGDVMRALRRNAAQKRKISLGLKKFRTKLSNA